MDPPPATARGPASKRRERRRRLSRRMRADSATATATGAGADVMGALQRESAAAPAPAPVATADAATPPATRCRKRRRSRTRRRRDPSDGAARAAGEAPAAAPVSDAISTQEGSAPQASCNLEAIAAHPTKNVLQTTTEKIMKSDKTRKRSFQAGNKALKVSAADGAACSSPVSHEHSARENEASRSKSTKRSHVRFPTESSAQGTDDTNMDYHEMKIAHLPENLEEGYQNGCHSLPKSQEYREIENISSFNSSSLQEGKKRKKKRGGRKHKRCKKATSQDSSPTEEQRKKQDQNRASMMNLVQVNNAMRSEAYGVNLEGTIENRCQLGTDSLNSTFENRYELTRSRNRLREQDFACSSNSHNVNYLSPSHLTREYMEKLKLVFSPGQSLVFPKKKLLILDLNGLLADINEDYHNAHMADAKVRGKLVFRRPYCDDFLNFCALNYELGIWSSRKRENVASVVNIVMREFKPRLLFCWDMSKCTFTGYKTLENQHKPLMLKELRKIWNMEEPGLPWKEGDYSPSNTLLVDDSPYKALRNPPHTAIFPRSYSYLNWNDNSLGPGGDLRVYLQNLAAADDVECFVRNNPFGQPFITERDPHWNFYAQIAGSGHAPLKYCA